MDILDQDIHSYKFFHSKAALESSIIFYASLRAYLKLSVTIISLTFLPLQTCALHFCAHSLWYLTFPQKTTAP